MKKKFGHIRHYLSLHLGVTNYSCTYLWVVRSKDKPPTEEEGYVEDSSADDKSDDTWQGETQRDEEHVVLVEVTEESKEARPLTEDCQAYDNSGDVHQLKVVDQLERGNRGGEERVNCCL